MTVEILHISDTHGESNTLPSLDKLAQDEHQIDVVALTGDIVSETGPTKELPEEWDDWRQQLKLSVPGNHDIDYEPFANIKNWVHDPPWNRMRRDLLFVGFGLNDESEILNYLRDTISDRKKEKRAIRGVVVLSHYRWEFDDDEDTIESLRDLLAKRALLLLHGHDHKPRYLPDGAEWEHRWRRDLWCTFYRSNVYSAWKNSGLAHKIEWSWNKFHCERVFGR